MSARNEAKAAPASPPWDSAPIIGFGKRSAVMRPEKEDVGVKGKLEIVASGLQFTGTSVLQVPYSELRLIFDVKGTTNRFGITTRKDDATYYFKTGDARGFVSKLNQLVGDPTSRKTGGVSGTPLEVQKMGIVLILIGAALAVGGILGFIFLPLFFVVIFIGMAAFGVVILVLGIRTMAAARHAAASTA